MRVRLQFFLLCLFFLAGCSPPGESCAPVELVPESQWIRPDGSAGSAPIWGVRGGISVGLWPTDGPRGLIRIYTPYLGQEPGRIMQFIAVEPIVGGQRDLSEMQTSSSDGKPGKMMWTADLVNLSEPAKPVTSPASGVITTENGIESLSFFIICEPFNNGAQPIVKVTFQSDRPHQILLQTYAASGSAGMDACVLSATMGNWSRLRHLQLKHTDLSAIDLFRHAKQDAWHFFPWQQWDADQLPIDHGEAVFSATGEPDLITSDQVPLFWRYTGQRAKQYWKTARCAGLVARVNGRPVFWRTDVAIPGGPAYENLELKAPFSNGQKFYYGVEPEQETR